MADEQWERFTRRTDGLKLVWLEKRLDDREIPHRRAGESWHAPITEVATDRLDEAEAILAAVDEWDDDDERLALDPMGEAYPWDLPEDESQGYIVAGPPADKTTVGDCYHCSRPIMATDAHRYDADVPYHEPCYQTASEPDCPHCGAMMGNCGGTGIPCGYILYHYPDGEEEFGPCPACTLGITGLLTDATPEQIVALERT